MFKKIIKNQNGFVGLMGVLIAIIIIGIMSAMLVPTFTAKMQYKQAKYAVGVIRTIENAENAYMAKNPGKFALLTTLASQGYLSSNFLQSVQGNTYPQPNWISAQIANHTVSVCIDNGSGCPNNPGVGTTGYFIGIYNIPHKFQTYIGHELPGSGANGTQDVSYVAPVPSAPPVANAQNANHANTAGYANSSGYANTAGYANSSGPTALSALQSAQPTYYGWNRYKNNSQYYAIYEMRSTYTTYRHDYGRCLSFYSQTITYYDSLLIGPGQQIPTPSHREGGCHAWSYVVTPVRAVGVFAG